jgi:hypothetical protein
MLCTVRSMLVPLDHQRHCGWQEARAEVPVIRVGAACRRTSGCLSVAARVLPEPGMGVKKGMVIVANKMALVATLAAARVGQGTGETA